MLVIIGLGCQLYWTTASNHIEQLQYDWTPLPKNIISNSCNIHSASTQNVPPRPELSHPCEERNLTVQKTQIGGGADRPPYCFHQLGQ